MNEDIRLLMSNVNTAIIQIRGAYATWAKLHGLNYHEVLIFYAIRDNKECTQQQIADNYRLPKQTVHNIITSLKKAGYIKLVPNRKNAKEKILTLTECGKVYYQSIINPIMEFEKMASEKMGIDAIQQMTALTTTFGQVLEESIVLQLQMDALRKDSNNEE